MTLKVSKNKLLSQYSTFRIGGLAKEFVAVKDEKELVGAVNYAKANKMPFFILGGGSNVLFSDKGFAGLVIKIAMEDIKMPNGGSTLRTEAGVSLAKIVDLAAKNGLTGMEWAAGIPGTIGGAIWGNAGAFDGNIAKVVTEVRVFDTAKMKFLNLSSKKCNFKYRHSIFKKKPELVILSVQLGFQSGDNKKINKKIKEILSKRKKNQPGWQAGCAGSFFQNPVVRNKDIINKFEKEKKVKVHSGQIPAGWLIEKAEFKGKKIGNIAVSEKNANFIINTGGGKAEEVVILAGIIKERVRQQFGIQLREEVQLVGF